MAILASSLKHLWHNIPTCSAYTSVIYPCKGRALPYRGFHGHSRRGPFPSKSPENARLGWHERTNSEPWLGSAPQVRLRFSGRQYAPDMRELLRGLWSQDKDPIWLLVDQLVTAGKPHNMADTCPDFPKWKHAVDAPNVLVAMESLAHQGNLPQFKVEIEKFVGAEDNDIEDSDFVQANPAPTWLVMYLVLAKVNNSAAAHAGVVFAISQVENTPESLRAPLLLLAMCAISGYRLEADLQTIIQAFQDVLAHKKLGSVTELVARSSIIYQCNAFLLLLSRFPLVPPISIHVDRLLRRMQAVDIPIETRTAARLIKPRKTSTFLVDTVQDILESQQVAPSVALSISLTRHFSRRRNQQEAARHFDVAQAVNPLVHAQSYITSFRSAADSLAHLHTVVSERRDVHQDDRTNKIGQRTSLESTLRSSSSPTVDKSETSHAAPSIMRYIHTSILLTAALSNIISRDTFSMMADSIRATYGTDKVLETVVLVGLLRRKAWDQARDLWSAWEAKSIELRHAANETESFFKRREKTLGDVAAVRKTLKMTEFQSFLLRRTAYNMQVDATALAAIVRTLAGPDTPGLLEAFEVMDSYAMKMSTSPSADQAGASDDTQDTHIISREVWLTSRVINCFLMRAFSVRRPDIVFRFWDSATRYYGAELSVPTLELVLRSARIAASMEDAIVSVIPRWFLRGTLRDTLPADAFNDLGKEIRWMLGPQCRPGTRWNGIPAWRVARRVFREDIIFANWPALRDIAVPAQPVTGDAATSRLDALQELAMGDPQMTRVGEYPHIVPRARTFREYVLLLSRVQRSTEIPQVLAWMRALDVRPSRILVSLFLALWAEVSIGPPADDTWAERDDIGGELRHGGEYGKLVTWLEEWLGKDKIPNDGETLASLKYVRELEQQEMRSTRN